MRLTSIQIVMLLCIWNSATELVTTKAKRIVCFYTGWSTNSSSPGVLSPEDIDPELCTHLVYAYASIDDDDKLGPLDIFTGGYTKFNSMKYFNINLQTILAVGKGLSSKMSVIAADRDRRLRFARNALMFLRNNRFSGINLSWHHPGSEYGIVEDKINYVLLLQALREEFERERISAGRPGLLISMDVPHNMKVLLNGFDIPSLNKYLDFMNVFTFDYQFPFGAEARHYSPLFSIAGQTHYGHESQFNADFTISYYQRMGVARDKLVLGIPTYGRTMILNESRNSHVDRAEDEPDTEDNPAKAGVISYYEICNIVLKTEGLKIENPLPGTAGPHARYGNYLVSYDDQNSVTLKAKYAAKEELGGIMFWTMDSDDFKGNCHGRKFPLINAGKEAFLASEKQLESLNNLHNHAIKPLHSLITSRKSVAEHLNAATLKRRIFIRTAELPGGDVLAPSSMLSDSSTDENVNTEIPKQLTKERKLILDQLISLVEKIGGVAALEKLLLATAKDSNRGFPSDRDHKRTFQADNYGPEVTSLTVTSAPLFLRKALVPIVFSNFTINIDELKIDASSFGST